MLPKTVSDIQECAFSGCISLEEVIFEDGSMLETICKSAFSDCTSLKGINFSSHLTNISDEAFFNCTSLKEIAIPSSVSTIGQKSFNKCSQLEKVTFEKDSKVRSFEFAVFGYCRSLEQINFPPLLNRIDKCAFTDCYKLKEASFPCGLTEIGNEAFMSCNSLNKVVFQEPSSLKSINGFAFHYCSSLTQISIPPSAEIYSNAFLHSGLEKICLKEPFDLKNIGLENDVEVVIIK